MAHRLITLTSGRQVGVSALGDPIARRLVLMCHPTPGAGVFDPDPEVTATWGVHLVALDRPGYGSTPADDDGPRTVEHRADELAEHLSRTRQDARDIGDTSFGPVGVVGWGTGGSVALSLAARHPDLVDKVAVVDTRRPSRAFLAGRPRVTPRRPDVSVFAAPGDVALSRPGLLRRLDRMLDEAWRHGDAGVECDRQMMADRRWARELGSVRADVLLVHGDDPRSADRADVAWHRRRVPGARSALVPDAGPLAVATRWARILDHVAPRHGHVPAPLRG